MKDFTQLSIGYHPTATVFVDDNKKSAIFTITQLFEEYNLACLLYDKPREALNFLNNEYHPDLFSKRSLVHDDEQSTFDNAFVKLDFTNIYKEIYNPNRFNQISSLIVDYGMPGLNGAEFCEQIINPSIKKIMLTGEADNDKAVDLFNQGIIDHFIAKDNPNLFEKLNEMIHISQQKFFAELSNIYIQFPKTLSCLSDKYYIELFNQLFKKSEAVEYYLLDDQGSFLFLDKDGNPSWFILAGEELMSGYYQFLYYRENVSPKIVSALKDKTMLPFFPTGELMRPDASEWENYLYPAEVLNGNETYYYAFIKQPRIHNLKLEQITSYQNYLDTIYQKYFDEFLES